MKKSLLLLITLWVCTVVAAKEETLSKTFDATGIHILQIESKYGEIKVETWENPEIAVDVFIKANSNKEQTVKKILDNVGVDFNQNDGRLVIKTDFGTFFSFMKFSNQLFRDGDFAIDYQIKVPKNIALDISLHDGNIILFERDANVKVTHSTGYISSQAIHGKGLFKLKDSHLKIKQIDSLLLEGKGSTLAIEQAKLIKGESYNCIFKITNVATIDLESVKDKFNMQQATELSITSSLSDIIVEDLKMGGILNSDYGSIQIHHITNDFDELKITGKGTAIGIDIENTAANIAISHHISTKMHIPDSLGLRMKFGESQKDFITTGTVGKPIGTSQILINTKGGTLDLK